MTSLSGRPKSPTANRRIKIACIGGGSQAWMPTIIRDIVFKRGMSRVFIDFVLLDTSQVRSQAIKDLFDAKFRVWGVDNVDIQATADAELALSNADFVIIAISTGRLKSMAHDLEIPERYGIYHTVGDTAGPGGWARALRNIPVFRSYARQIKELAPNAFVLNYTNPMGALTRVLADELGNRVVGLCHGLFECYETLSALFGLRGESDIHVNFGGLNHFFWFLDFRIKGRDGYELFKDKLQGRNLAEAITEHYIDTMGFSSHNWLAGELLEKYGYLPYIADRHICEFFADYITDLEEMKRLKLVRTSIRDREDMYAEAAENIRLWTSGKRGSKQLSRKPSRETAADIIKAVTFDEGFVDVVNVPNTGQMDDLPRGAVVETLGYIRGSTITPFVVGKMPEPITELLLPHAHVQLKTVEAGMSGDMELALKALALDPVCARLSVEDIRKMGFEMLEANKEIHMD
ncbi:MAG: family 4 glycosyl hydrolase [Armatimonadota bacterium]